MSLKNYIHFILDGVQYSQDKTGKGNRSCVPNWLLFPFTLEKTPNLIFSLAQVNAAISTAQDTHSFLLCTMYGCAQLLGLYMYELFTHIVFSLHRSCMCSLLQVQHSNKQCKLQWSISCILHQRERLSAWPILRERKVVRSAHVGYSLQQHRQELPATLIERWGILCKPGHCVHNTSYILICVVHLLIKYFCPYLYKYALP